MDELSFFGSCLSLALAIIAATILLPLSLLVRRALSTKETGGPRLPPGPWNLPVLGSLHHLLGAPPHRALLRLSRRHGPLMQLRLGEVLTFVVSSPEAAMEVMKTKDPAFAGRPRGPTVDVVGRGLVFAPYGAYWQQMRKVCVAELLGARHVRRRMERIRQAEVSRLVESVVGSASAAAVVNLSEALAVLTNNVIARAVFGAECRQRQAFLRELDVVATMAGVFSLPDLYPSSRLVRWLSRGDMRHLRRSYARVQRIVDGVIQDRIKARRGTFAAVDGAAGADDDVQDEDLLDVLLRLQVEGSLAFPLTAETICAVVSVSAPSRPSSCPKTRMT
ncbi:hypothetical protein U9M48_007711 [Paspalum notatum var. saurae]|uniref:Cytochrome P450 n=1 Tax=Paspalum notatum var. saurae TaxID=547442 RepID=A0AAQ3WCA8_PASNO